MILEPPPRLGHTPARQFSSDFRMRPSPPCWVTRLLHIHNKSKQIGSLSPSSHALHIYLLWMRQLLAISKQGEVNAKGFDGHGFAFCFFVLFQPYVSLRGRTVLNNHRRLSIGRQSMTSIERSPNQEISNPVKTHLADYVFSKLRFGSPFAHAVEGKKSAQKNEDPFENPNPSPEESLPPAPPQIQSWLAKPTAVAIQKKIAAPTRQHWTGGGGGEGHTVNREA